MKPLGFPFNQYFPFFVLSVLSVINAALCSKIPSYLDKSQRLNDENLNNEKNKGIDLKSNKITNITVSRFVPNYGKRCTNIKLTLLTSRLKF